MTLIPMTALGVGAGLHNYAPGKFPSLVGRYQEWTERRRHFIAPYALTWLLYLVLCSHRGW